MTRTKRRSTRAAALVGAVALAFVGAVASAQPAPPGVPVAAGLSNPRGLTQDGADILIAELGTGQILRLAPDGSTTVVVDNLPTTTFFSEETGTDEVAGPSAVIPVSGGYAFTVAEGPESSMQSVYFATEGGEAILLADLGAYEQANNTDGDVNLAGEPDVVSNPYDLVQVGDDLLVSNSGANAILRIAADGTVTPYAIFPNRENPLFPNVGGPTMDQVPTGLEIGPDGALYVGTLTGFPFPQGGARVYRMEDLNADGDALDDGETTVFAEGLSTVTDIDFDANGDLIATSFSVDMLTQAPGQVVRVSGGSIEVIANGLISPTAVLVSDGRIIVSQEFTGLVTDVTDAGVVPLGAPPAPADTGSLGSNGTGEGGSGALVALALLAGAVLVTGASRRLTGVAER